MVKEYGPRTVRGFSMPEIPTAELPQLPLFPFGGPPGAAAAADRSTKRHLRAASEFKYATRVYCGQYAD